MTRSLSRSGDALPFMHLAVGVYRRLVAKGEYENVLAKIVIYGTRIQFRYLNSAR